MNEQVANVRRFYPATVSIYENGFGWCWSTPYFYGQSYHKPVDELGELERFESLCTVEVLEYPDGTYSAAWFPGEFRGETSPDAQN